MPWGAPKLPSILNTAISFGVREFVDHDSSWAPLPIAVDYLQQQRHEPLPELKGLTRKQHGNRPLGRFQPPVFLANKPTGRA